MKLWKTVLLCVLVYVTLTTIRHYFGEEIAHSATLLFMGFCIGGLTFGPRS